MLPNSNDFFKWLEQKAAVAESGGVEKSWMHHTLICSYDIIFRAIFDFSNEYVT